MTAFDPKRTFAKLPMPPTKRKPIVIVGYWLIALAFACLFVVAIIATLEGSLGVTYRGSGRPAVFMPVVYVPVLAGIVVVGGIWVFRRMSRKTGKPTSAGHESRERD